MKILLTGDSITDMNRNRDLDYYAGSYGNGYPFFIEGELATRFPMDHQVINRGISGNRIVDVYARIKCDMWNLEPDVISILIGINDIWHELGGHNGVELDRYENIYDIMLSETKKRLPKAEIMLLEPFVLEGDVTRGDMDKFLEVKDYAKVVKKLAEKYNCHFVPLQARLDEVSKIAPTSHWLADGVHPTVAGAKIIADEWIKCFCNEVLKK